MVPNRIKPPTLNVRPTLPDDMLWLREDGPLQDVATYYWTLARSFNMLRPSMRPFQHRWIAS